MASGAKRVLKQLLPPLAVPLARSIAARSSLRPEWQYVPQGWRDDDARNMGWHHPTVVEAQRRRWSDFLAAIQSPRPLGVEQESVEIQSESPSGHNAILTFLYGVARAAATRDSVSILDWGGGLGYYAAIARAALPEIAFDYTIKELPGVCLAGRDLLQGVQFVSDPEACLSRRYDLIFASNSLQYTKDWPSLLARFAQCAERWVLLTRLPLVDKTTSFIVVQRPHWVGYKTEYISWVLNRDELLAQAASEGLVLEREFLSVDERSFIVGAPEQCHSRGFLFCAPQRQSSATVGRVKD
jgi:putative methyltransferase (TIGR04325 family)